jgi:3-oxoacyl-[acyl-carrier protein] reductase
MRRGAEVSDPNVTLGGTVALVTGAASGMGAEMALALLGAGASVLAVDVAQEGLSGLAGRAKTEGADATRLRACRADVSDEEACRRAVGQALDEFGRLDLLVNDAGVGMRSIDEGYARNPVRFWQADPARWRRLMDINVAGAFLMARAAVPHMIERGSGAIVNVTTSLDTMLSAGMAPYGPSKAALEASTAVWAKDLDGTGVTANVLVPGGPVDSPFLAPDTQFPRDKLIKPDIMRIPIVWLASPEAEGVTGRRFIARLWDTDLASKAAAEAASAPVAWEGYGPQAVRPDR